MSEGSNSYGADSVWWDGAVGYEIYIRSFADSNGDGIGDLAGIEAHLDHIAWLGADIVWITPFMPSPGFDHGYDISDYRNVDPTHGTVADFERVVARAHELGLRVLVDLVPNHTSSSHPWFVDAVSGPDSAHRDRYVWRSGASMADSPTTGPAYFEGRCGRARRGFRAVLLPPLPSRAARSHWANPAVVEGVRRHPALLV
ncbi:MAG: alpha-amylase family glycosyl hydrolase [Acidimicrobiales bacterium]